MLETGVQDRDSTCPKTGTLFDKLRVCDRTR